MSMLATQSLVVKYELLLKRRTQRDVISLYTVQLYLGEFVLFEYFFTHLETSSLPMKSCKFWPLVGSYGLWAVKVLHTPHLLGHRTSVYNSHLRGPETLTPIAEPLAVAAHYLFLRLRSVAAGIRTPNFSPAGRTLNLTAPPQWLKHSKQKWKWYLEIQKPNLFSKEAKSRLVENTQLHPDS